MTEIVFVFSIFIQLFRIFSRRNRAGYAMRFTFKAHRAEQKERAKKLPDQSFSLADSIKKPHTLRNGQSILCVWGFCYASFLGRAVVPSSDAQPPLFSDVKQQIRVGRHRPVFLADPALQLVGNLPGGFHRGDDGLVLIHRARVELLRLGGDNGLEPLRPLDQPSPRSAA